MSLGELRLDHKNFGTPLPQQNLTPQQVASFLNKKWGWEVKWNNNGNGFLTNCPSCGKNKLLYSQGGKMFICLDYSDCGKKFLSFLKLKKQQQQKKSL